MTWKRAQWLTLFSLFYHYLDLLHQYTEFQLQSILLLLIPRNHLKTHCFTSTADQSRLELPFWVPSYSSSETQGRSVGPGEKTRQKFSSTGGKAPGYRLSPDHFQTVKRMLAPDWAQKMLCIIVPNWRTASPEFFSWVRTRRLLGTLSKDDDDGSKNAGKKWICVLSNLIASIWTRSICQMQATFPGVEFLRILFRFKKRKENSSSYVHVLHKTSN